jgi:hypothetical protein
MATLRELQDAQAGAGARADDDSTDDAQEGARALDGRWLRVLIGAAFVLATAAGSGAGVAIASWLR